MDVDVVFINVILFYYWVDGRDHFKNDFKKSRTDLRTKSV